MPCILITVCLHNGRYHGRPEWPPSPARLFQALVAGAAHGETLVENAARALEWLERLDSPVIAVPANRAGQGFQNFVPNNDLDALGGDLGRMSEIRAPKLIRPMLFDAETPLLYAWTFEDVPEAHTHALQMCAIAERLYQFGRGLDMAWARGEIIGASDLKARLAAYWGATWRPSNSGKGVTLLVPLAGSLQSLLLRNLKMRERFQKHYETKPSRKEPDRKKAAGQFFVQPPNPLFHQVAYDSPPARLLFDLSGGKVPWCLERIVALTESVRNAAARKLKGELPFQASMIDNVIVGRRDAHDADKAARVQITPLPSIGHQHADWAIRRLLVEIPANCPLRVEDVEWVFAGLDAFHAEIDPPTGEVHDELVLTPATDSSMPAQYGLDDSAPSHLWRTVTPAALPQQGGRRCMEPTRREAKGGPERAEEENKACAAVAQALRHVCASVPVHSIHVQREPFEGFGPRAEAFADRTRFAKERLWHVEVAFAQPLRGPLIIGDGRYLGLGLMRPVRGAWRDALAFTVSRKANIAVGHRVALLHAVRRALMALDAASAGKPTRLFSGHEPNGAPLRRGGHNHVFLAADNADGEEWIDRLVVVAPWACDRSVKPEQGDRQRFDTVASSLRTVRAGGLGVIELGKPMPLAGDDALIAPSLVWQSRVPYRATRHAGRGKEAVGALARDLVAECLRRGWPRPEVDILEYAAMPNGGGLTARARLRFAHAVAGPLLLGRDSHRGGGLFAGVR
ncbi:MAG: type I-U CRISPR-associated protein Csb2 [Sphingomonadaceae bacterium]